MNDEFGVKQGQVPPAGLVLSVPLSFSGASLVLFSVISVQRFLLCSTLLALRDKIRQGNSFTLLNLFFSIFNDFFKIQISLTAHHVKKTERGLSPRDVCHRDDAFVKGCFAQGQFLLML